jgi:hypothetical protein
VPSSTPMDCSPFPIRRLDEVEPAPPNAKWLIQELWLASGVGLLGGQAKVCKTYLAAELSFAVATGLPALGRYTAAISGPVLFYGAEDHLAALRTRFEGLARARDCKLDAIDVYFIDMPVVRLDQNEHIQRLRASLKQCRPKLLVLDPFVRLVGAIDENSASDVSTVLGSLRAIQRECDVAVLLVHHARKSPAATPYQAYRGSSDFSAWSDTNLFLCRKAKHLVLNVEHRSAPSPDPLLLHLNQDPAPHLVPLGQPLSQPQAPEQDTLATEVIALLQNTARPLTTVAIRDSLHRRKSDIIKALHSLRDDKIIEHCSHGWKIPETHLAPAIPLV